jgi:hypothetical protein
MGIAFEYMVFTRPPNVPFQQATIQARSAQGIARETSNKRQGSPFVTWLTTNMTERGLVKYVKESTFKYVS